MIVIYIFILHHLQSIFKNNCVPTSKVNTRNLATLNKGGNVSRRCAGAFWRKNIYL